MGRTVFREIQSEVVRHLGCTGGLKTQSTEGLGMQEVRVSGEQVYRG